VGPPRLTVRGRPSDGALYHTLEIWDFPQLMTPRLAGALAAWRGSGVIGPGSLDCVIQSGWEEDRRYTAARPGRSAVAEHDVGDASRGWR